MARGWPRFATLVVLAALAGACDASLYHPPRSVPQDRCGLNPERVDLLAADSTPVFALFRPPAEGRRRVLVTFHGNASDVWGMSCAMAPYAEAGFGLMLVSYRGYGGNRGEPSEQGLYQDARAALDHLEAVRGLPAADLILFGQSLGSGVAVQMAAERGDDAPFGALVLLSPFTSTDDVADALFWYVPLPAEAVLDDRYASIDKIARIASPILILHGEEDTLIPPAQSEALCAAATAPTTCVRLSGVGHNDLHGNPRKGIDCRRYDTHDERCAVYWFRRFAEDLES